jgi:methylglyoxal synthase
MRIVEGALDLSVFFWHLLTAQLQESDVRAWLRIALVSQPVGFGAAVHT